MPTQERTRRHLVNAVLLIYLLLIFEGALRKWLLPEFSLYIFFIRDPVLLYVYLLATRHRLWPARSGWLKLSLWMGLVGLLLLALQSALGPPSDVRWLLGVYGWRAYFFYVPLAFLVGAQFQAADLQRVFKITLWLAVPMAVLVTAQFFAPQNAPINVGISGDAELQFRGLGQNAERTRPMGTFSSGAGQQQFVATALTLVLAAFISPLRQRPVPAWLLWPALAGVAVCMGLSGSRGTVLQCALAGVAALLLGFVGRGVALKTRALLWPLLLAAAAALLYPLLLPEGFAAFSERWITAAQVESSTPGGIFGRTLIGFVDFIRLLDTVPLLGYGLGYGGNASTTLAATVDGVMPGKLAETDFARHMVDLGPIFGLAFIVFRVCLVVWLTAQVMRITRSNANPVPLMLLSYVAYVLLLGQVTGQGAINAYTWLFVGLCIAACRLSTPRPGAGHRAPQAAARRGATGRPLLSSAGALPAH